MNSVLASCCNSPYSKRAILQSAVLMIGSSLALVLVYLALTKQYGKTTGAQALLYSSFNIALVLSSLPTYLKTFRPGVRVVLVILGTAVSYGFFYGVTLLGERT